MSAPSQERQLTGAQYSHCWGARAPRPLGHAPRDTGKLSRGRRKARAPALPVALLELCFERRNVRVFERLFAPMLLVTSTDITVWIVSALLALGIGAGKYAKWKARNQLVRELAAMDRERREKVLSRMNPAQAMEARQELMRRFNIF